MNKSQKISRDSGVKRGISGRLNGPRGQLTPLGPSSVKNSKTWLRKKGVLMRPKKAQLDGSCDDEAEEGQTQEMAAVEWLKRNREPFEDVIHYWKVCQRYRLKALFNSKTITPIQYIKQWFGLLQLPQGYKLILEDFNNIHSVVSSYATIEGTADNLMINWQSVGQKVEALINAKDSTVDLSEVKDIIDCLENDVSEDVKDYALLQILACMCKPRSRVKVGEKTYKPSSKEAWDAFILHVLVAGDLQNAVKKRRDIYQGMKATLQPFIIVVGASKLTVDAAYVCIEGALWKLGSILQALDICFKTFFCVHAAYPPEAYHLWLLVQHLLYGFQVKGERSVANVTTLVSKLSPNRKV